MRILDTQRCPVCNCKLLTDGVKVWCFFGCEKKER